VQDYRVDPGSAVNLADIDPNAPAELTKQSVKEETRALNRRLGVCRSCSTPKANTGC